MTDAGVKVNLSQKPLLELEFLLRVCHQGGWVVDLCCGSGSGLIAAMRLGYNVAGFDIKEAQVNATKARIQKFSEQEVCPNVTHTAVTQQSHAACVTTCACQQYVDTCCSAICRTLPTRPTPQRRASLILSLSPMM